MSRHHVNQLYVQFELVPVRTNITSRVYEPSLPPEEQVKAKIYAYTPCQPATKDPLALPFFHSLLEPGQHLDDYWTRYMPKKLREVLAYNPQSAEPVIGWGLYIIEGPNWYVLTWLTLIFVVFSVALALVYSCVTRDVSSGFTVGSFVLGALAVIGTTLSYNR